MEAIGNLLESLSKILPFESIAPQVCRPRQQAFESAIPALHSLISNKQGPVKKGRMLTEQFKLKVDDLRVTSDRHHTAMELHVDMKFCLIYIIALADFKTRERH